MTEGLRERLRHETAEIHERLHRHSGLGAAARGSITAEDYVQLLARLLGFHRAYEAALAEACIEAVDPVSAAGQAAQNRSLWISRLWASSTPQSRTCQCARKSRAPPIGRSCWEPVTSSKARR